VPQLLTLLSLAGAVFSEADAAQVVESNSSSKVTVDGWAYFGPGNGVPLFQYEKTLTNTGHGALMFESQDFDSLTPNSHSVTVSGSASTRISMGATGQVAALSSGVSVRASAGDGPQMTASARALSEGNLNVTFDEQVNIRVAYIVGATGGLASFGAQGGQWNFDQGAGVVDLVGSNFWASANAGARASVDVDGYPDDDRFPSEASASFASRTTLVSWAISPIDEEPILPGKQPNKPILVAVRPRPWPVISGGFDPIPIATQDMIATSSELSYVGINTKIILDNFEESTQGIVQGTIISSFEVKSSDNPFTSFLLHDLPIGSNLNVKFGNEVRTVVAGEPIDFGAEGIESFVLEGLDPAHSSVAPDALVFGVGFAETGLVQIEVSPIETFNTGDFDFDGTVSAADYTSWRDHLGLAVDALHAQGDANGDGAVDAADYLLWKKGFGFVSPSESIAAGVPEPSTLALFTIGCAAIGYRRNNRSVC